MVDLEIIALIIVGILLLSFLFLIYKDQKELRKKVEEIKEEVDEIEMDFTLSHPNNVEHKNLK